MPADQPESHDAFARWWTDLGASLTQPPETLARSTWDAAIRSAVLLLHDEVERLVHDARYREAAATRDCRELVTKLFTSPGQWSVEQHWEKGVEVPDNSSQALPPKS